ncbi:MAG: hypothetical protein H0X12_15810, partial [Nocardioides sp.]|nr:hypothetical protein [Nocardioides sp.]
MSDLSNLPVILARMDSLVEKQADLTGRLDRLTDTLANTYVPKGEYGAHQEAADRRFKEL